MAEVNLLWIQIQGGLFYMAVCSVFLYKKVAINFKQYAILLRLRSLYSVHALIFCCFPDYITISVFENLKNLNLENFDLENFNLENYKFEKS